MELLDCIVARLGLCNDEQAPVNIRLLPLERLGLLQ